MAKNKKERRKAVEYAPRHKEKSPNASKPKKPKDPWAKELRKARRELAQSARLMDAQSNNYNGSRGMRNHGTKL